MIKRPLSSHHISIKLVDDHVVLEQPMGQYGIYILLL